MFYTDNALSWLQSILEEHFGQKFELRQEPHAIVLKMPGEKGEIRFDQLQTVFHENCSDFPCRSWSASKEGFRAPIEDVIPAPSRNQLILPLVEVIEATAIVHYDILGLTYWMLNRLEEIGRSDLDGHERFPATSSHAFKYGYIDRPLVDEWLIILGQVISRIWTNVDLQQRRFEVHLSHDVDRPSLYAFAPWSKIIRMMAGHLIKRRDLKGFFAAPYIKLRTKRQLHKADPYNTFDWLMDLSEEAGLRSAFYFICGTTEPSKDADYEVEHPVIRNLMRQINKRGHEIGIHPSYGTFQSPGLIKKEIERLRKVCFEEGIEQAAWGGRMHYLRWEQPTTLRAWANAAISYDSTLGYADRPGFRCGTCHEYFGFDPVEQKRLTVRVRPLVVMECTVVGSQYLNFGAGTASEDKILLLKERCRKVEGSFTMLWHNSNFESPVMKEMYRRIVSVVSDLKD